MAAKLFRPKHRQEFVVGSIIYDPKADRNVRIIRIHAKHSRVENANGDSWGMLNTVVKAQLDNHNLRYTKRPENPGSANYYGGKVSEEWRGESVNTVATVNASAAKQKLNLGLRVELWDNTVVEFVLNRDYASKSEASKSVGRAMNNGMKFIITANGGVPVDGIRSWLVYERKNNG